MRQLLVLGVFVSLLTPLSVFAATIEADGSSLNVTSVGIGTSIGKDGYDYFAARPPTGYNNFNVPDKESFPSFATYAPNINVGDPSSATQNYSFDNSFTTLTIDGTSNVTGSEYTAFAGGGGPDSTLGTITFTGTVPDGFRLGLLVHNRVGTDNPTYRLDLSSAAGPVLITTGTAALQQNDFYFVQINGAAMGDTLVISAPSDPAGVLGGLAFSVPEPSTAAMLMLLATGTMARARRARQS